MTSDNISHTRLDADDEDSLTADQSVNTGEPEASTPTKLLPLPDVGDLLFIGIMYILLFARPGYMFMDASVGWHLAAGKWIFEQHKIPYTDLFSYTFPNKAWVAYEWLFDLGAYVLTMLGGLNLLAVAVSAIIAYALVAVYDRARNEGAPLAIATPVAIVGIFASAVHWLARPHIITFATVFWFVNTLEDFHRGTIRATRLFAVLCLSMLLWVNCHPSFILGLGLIGIYFAISLFQGKRTIAKNLFAAGVACTAVTFLNPYGFGLHKYIFEYLHGSVVLSATDEFKSPIFHGDIHAFFLEVLIFVLIVGLAITKKRLSLPYFSLILLFLHMALTAVRNIPYFAIVSVPAIGLLYSETRCGDWNMPSGLKNAIDRIARPLSEFEKQEKLCKMRLLSIGFVIVMAIAAMCGGSIAGVKVLSSGFNKFDAPTKTLDYIAEHKLPYDHGFNYDNWGGLIRYKLNQRVFIDDRADFYGEPFYIRYGNVVQTEPGWEKILDEDKIQWVLMPVNAKLSKQLKDRKGWSLAAEDDASMLFVRANNDHQI